MLSPTRHIRLDSQLTGRHCQPAFMLWSQSWLMMETMKIIEAALPEHPGGAALCV